MISNQFTSSEKDFLQNLANNSNSGLKYSINLRNSSILDENLWAENPNFDDFVRRIAGIGLPQQGLKSERVCQHMKIVLLNLMLHRGKCVAYSRGQNTYPSNRHNPANLKARYMAFVVDLLRGNDLISHWPGFKFDGMPGRYSRMKANDTLQDMFDGLGKVRFCSHPSRENILLRDEYGESVPYGWELPGKKADPQFVVGMRNRLAKVNALLSDAELALDVPEHALDLHRVFLRRIFNGGWQRGGRHYGGWWQQANKEERKHILIDGGETIECDYCSNQANILYLKAIGKTAPSDPYVLPGFENNPAMRSAVKFVFMVLFNATFADINNETGDLIELVQCSKKLSNESKKAAADAGIENVVKLLRGQNRAIWSYAGSGVGGEIQYEDSRVAERVLEELSALGVVCLPVFDSFIVRREHEELLKECMGKAYFAYWNDCPEIRSE